MNEKQAWEYLAQAWETAKEGEDGYYAARLVCSGKSWLGLCACIGDLEWFVRITKPVADSMRRKINDLVELKNISGYLWPLDKSGAEERVKFCRARAAEIEG